MSGTRIGVSLLAVALLAGFGCAQTPEALRAHVSYLASDKLDGRLAPSRGLDMAADYIAAEFRKAGLEMAFQTFPMKRHPVRNVTGILRGSDPVLSKQFIIVSAHYDHEGHGYPGANDDASGTATVIELASVLAASPEKPKRSILFIAFAAEEEGLLGSGYYAAHPLVPLKDTVAVINLEQLGRTDEETGTRLRSFAMTGTSKSNLADFVADAVAAAGVRIYHRPDEDAFYDRGDNFPFAAKGVVNTTIVVAFEFPDYHRHKDTANRIDYENLAAVARGISAAVLHLADSSGRPVLLPPASVALLPPASAALLP